MIHPGGPMIHLPQQPKLPHFPRLESRPSPNSFLRNTLRKADTPEPQLRTMQPPSDFSAKLRNADLKNLHQHVW